MLGADLVGQFRAEIGLEQIEHRTENRQARHAERAAFSSKLPTSALMRQRIENDAGRFADLGEHAVELPGGTDQRMTCSTGTTLAYCAVAARATVISVSPVESDTRWKWKWLRLQSWQIE